MQNGSCRQPQRTKEMLRLFLNLASILAHAKNPMTWPSGSFVPTFDWTRLATSPMNAIDGGKTHPLLVSIPPTVSLGHHRIRFTHYTDS